ncbi:uncharacterized protein [Physcomitrium patens]|uniref:Uncharacterized protein n=1 Tax=Physcomitrium patens TaxID=3218 RepID=A0A2K1J514_PHYPA|nr:uncharacterized protein LOC112294682 [Physcomitrium patens]XP_024401182.1 uncharacterized protein LOC112294682 [Physcomitrium patens]XP_024401183.1 uncharacterized protein LOC112294682 [Physcomitrium patens]XP_024401184.1 uncharacterized protein LOC112294682 [Physcomitrium patens]PNR36615.1 hypothetical protein PHYPA_022466 [Physcomitrium patens]|eukprot:XP_024401180.1 uncharacterized protein LOC112294682 [Physcomitrella patens]
MALSSGSQIVLPYSQSSSGIPWGCFLPRHHARHSQAIRKLQLLPDLILHASSCSVRRGGKQRALSKSIRGKSAENSAQYEDTRIDTEAGQSWNYAATRTYRKAMASLRVTGNALPLQVNAALAADGGRTAVQELKQGKAMLVIEAYNPGQLSEGSTVSTKLQAPTLAVIERAKLMAEKDAQFLRGGRAFAVAFQTVRLLKLSKFELCFYQPGTMKATDGYGGEIAAFLEVSDASCLSEIAKGVCSYALACVKDNAEQRAKVEGFGSIPFLKRSEGIKTTVKNSTVQISSFTEAEVSAHVERIVQDKKLVGTSVGLRRHRSWWNRPLATEAVVKSGLDAQLVDEFLPAHKLQLNLPSNKFEAVGLQKTSDTVCSINLTHAQMMDLADVLDLYSGDPYTGSGESVSMSLDIPRRSWAKVVQTVAVGALATAIGGALLAGFLSSRRARLGQMDAPIESIFDMAFSQKLREIGRSDIVDEQMDSVNQQSEVKADHTEAIVKETTEGAGLDEQSEPVIEQPAAEQVYKPPTRVQFRTRTQF